MNTNDVPVLAGTGTSTGTHTGTGSRVDERQYSHISGCCSRERTIDLGPALVADQSGSGTCSPRRIA